MLNSTSNLQSSLPWELSEGDFPSDLNGSNIMIPRAIYIKQLRSSKLPIERCVAYAVTLFYKYVAQDPTLETI